VFKYLQRAITLNLAYFEPKRPKAGDNDLASFNSTYKIRRLKCSVSTIITCSDCRWSNNMTRNAEVFSEELLGFKTKTQAPVSIN